MKSMHPFKFHILGLMLILSLSRLCGVYGEVICLEMRMFTPSKCEDNPGYSDWSGDGCTEYEGLDCWSELINDKQLYAEEAMDAIRKCPDSCNLCKNKKMFIELIDVSTNALPVLLSDSDFTGIGTSLKSPPSLSLHKPSVYLLLCVFKLE